LLGLAIGISAFVPCSGFATRCGDFGLDHFYYIAASLSPRRRRPKRPAGASVASASLGGSENVNHNSIYAAALRGVGARAFFC